MSDPDIEVPTTEHVRNAYADRYGPEESIYAEFDEWLRRVKEATWQEGQQAGYENAYYAQTPPVEPNVNPYRRPTSA